MNLIFEIFISQTPLIRRIRESETSQSYVRQMAPCAHEALLTLRHLRPLQLDTPLYIIPYAFSLSAHTENEDLVKTVQVLTGTPEAGHTTGHSFPVWKYTFPLCSTKINVTAWRGCLWRMGHIHVSSSRVSSTSNTANFFFRGYFIDLSFFRSLFHTLLTVLSEPANRWLVFLLSELLPGLLPELLPAVSDAIFF